jgi:putative flippase GtrA
MFGRMIDDLKESTGTAVRQTSLAAAAAFALLVTTAFLCAALFVFMLQKYGPVEACLAGAGVFFVITLIAAVCYMVRRNQLRVRAEEAAREAARSARSAASNMLADPMLLAAGLQVVRAIGVKKLIPILAIGGVALGFMMSRGAGAADDEAEAEAPAE